MSAIIEVSPDLVREFTGQDVLCLDPVCQPVVDQMQAVIRFQRDQLQMAVAAMDYALRRQGSSLLGTQQFTNLTAAIAEINGQDVDHIRNHYIHGSAGMHREREVA